MSKKDKLFSIHHPDDNLFGKVLREIANARAYLEQFYPKIAEQADLDTLTLESDSFLTEEFDLFKADIIYRCQWKDSEDALYFSLLWEHKRQAETYVAIQMGLYIFLAMHKMTLEKDRPLEPVLPLLFYNGERAWQPKTIYDLFRKKAYFDFFKPYLPNFDFLFKNISQIPTKEILAIKEAFFRSAMLAMANRNNTDLIFQHINLIFDLEKSYHINIMAVYLVAIMNSPPEEIRKLFQQVKGNQKKAVMSTLEMILKEGEEKGKAIGIKEGKAIGVKEGEVIGAKKREMSKSLLTLLKIFDKFPKWSIAEIVQFTELKKSFIVNLRTAFVKKDRKEIRAVIKKQLLGSIVLSKTEQAKINRMISKVLKKK